ncbi:MAG: dicarboxylate/amino acid:cation symporter [Flavobacteriales bacterium]|nr:dicarboxylate/amino acid:cation symporter [Flavobacteriales bacterium]|tara:strand:+ start:13754 stop:15025 length:1272 start_codon:yes stop_codon:yes gene_type:complete
MSKIALHWKIIIGMVLGIVYGLIASSIGWIDFTNNWIKPWGVIFVSLLKLIAVPLVFASLIKGVASLSDISKLSRIGGKTIFIYLISTVIAVSLGLFLVNIVKPGANFDKSSVKLTEKSQFITESKIITAENLNQSGPLQFLVDIVPANIFLASSNNSNMLQVIFFAILFGIAMIMLPSAKTVYVKGFFDGVNDIILQIVDLIMRFSPYGVFALLGGLLVDYGASSNLFIALGKYSLTVVIGLLFMIFFVYPLIISFLTKVKYLDFFNAISPAQMLAFSTSSSAATLPVTMERCEEKLGVSKEVSSFVLPLGATINMDGTSLYQAVAAVFIAQAFGIELDLSQQLTIVLTATLASIGAAAVPGAGMVMLVIVLGAINVPAEGLALIFGVDRILDMIRTVVNVTGDATVATVVASTEGQLKNLS